MRSFLSEIQLLITRLRSKDSFVRNFAVTFSWNTAAVIIGFLFVPFIARLYSPEAYGLFAVYMSLAQNLSLLATLQLTRAYTLAESEAELQGLLRTTLVSAGLLILFVSIFCFFFKDQLLNFFNIAPIGGFLYLLPLTAFLYSICDIYRSWNVRHKYFQRNAVNQVIASVMARSLAIGYALVMPVRNVGLIVGDLLSKLIESIHLGWSGGFWETSRSIYSSSTNGIQGTLKRFKNYPLFILPSSLITVLASQIPLFFVTKFYDAENAGFYSLANSMLNVPVNVLAGAIAPIFLHKATELSRIGNMDEVGKLVKEVSDKLFFLGVVPIIILIVYGDLIFLYVFGEKWLMAGIIAGKLGFYFLLTVINTPLLSIFRIYKREKYMLISISIQVILSFITLSVGYYLFDLISTITLFAVFNSIYYVANIFLLTSIVGVTILKSMLRWVAVASLSYGMVMLTRQFLLG